MRKNWTNFCKLSFLNSNNEEVGILDFNGSELKFTGNASESAEVFLDFIVNSFRNRLAEERGHCAKLCNGADKNISFKFTII